MANKVEFSVETDGNHYTFKVKSGKVEHDFFLVRKGRVYTVEDYFCDGADDRSPGFQPDSAGVENLDKDSDSMQCFNISTRIRYDNVEMGSLEMRANSVEELAYALSQVKIRSWSREEI